MAVGLILLNAALIGGVLVVIAGGMLWAIATQHRDHQAASAGPLLRRRVWSPSGRGQETIRRPSVASSYGRRAHPTW